MSGAPDLPLYVRRPPLRGALGSLASTWGLEVGLMWPAIDCAAVILLGLAGVPLPPALQAVAWTVLGVWFLWVAVQARHIAASRRVSRAAGLVVLIVVPESPDLLRRLCGRVGLSVPWRPYAVAVHVDERWRRPPGLSPKEAAAKFGRLYEADYDRVLGALAGRAALVVSSTFNRHESAWTRRAAAEGWCLCQRGPLFARAPSRHRRRARFKEQRRMFGGVVSERPVDRPEAWRTRVFDCVWYRMAPKTGGGGVGLRGADGGG